MCIRDRLYFGSYFRAPSLASWMPSRNSGTNCFGSFRNFFTSSASLPVLLAPSGADRLEDHADRCRAGVDGADAPFARVRGAATHREHALGVLGRLHRHVGGPLERGRPVVALHRRVADRRLEAVGGRHEGIEQGLLPERRAAPGHDPGDCRPEDRDDVLGRELGPVARRDAGAKEGRAPDRTADAADLAREREADLLEDGPGARVVECRVVAEDDLPAVPQRVAEVAVPTMESSWAK